MIIDIIFVLIIILSGVIGYFKGFFRELYSIINIFISLLLMYLINNVIGFHILSNFIQTNVKAGNCESIELVDKYLTPILSGIVLYILIYIILSIVIKYLIKKNLIPNNKEILRILGVTLSLFKGIIFITFISFLLSFTTLTKDFNVYEKSSLTSVFLKINPPLNNLSKNTKKLYYDLLEVSPVIGFLNSNDKLTEEQMDSLKELFNNDLITEDFLIESSKVIFNNLDINREDLVIPEEVDMNEVKEAIIDSNIYLVLKDLYEDKIINDKLIKDIIEENNLDGINTSDIIKLIKD
ncbi:MAG: CvpA family protein [Bacilli bacterium]